MPEGLRGLVLGGAARAASVTGFRGSPGGAQRGLEGQAHARRAARRYRPGLAGVGSKGQLCEPSGERRKHCLARETDPAPAGLFFSYLSWKVV